MTVSTSPDARDSTPRGPRRLRVVLPFAVVFTLIVVTLTAHVIEQPDPADGALLSPVSGADIGADKLANRLRARGVVVERQSSTPPALQSTRTGPAATLFITAPYLVHPEYLAALRRVPPDTRVVLVAPGAAALDDAGLPAEVQDIRWAAAAPAPGCTEPVAAAAGPAAALRQRFAALRPAGFRCYDGGLVEIVGDGPAVTLVGALDPFRNDRIDEHGNAALAVGLLSRNPRVIWLDLHAPEKGPAPARSTRPPLPWRTDQPPDGAADPSAYYPGLPGDPAAPTDAPRAELQDEEPEAEALTDNSLARAFPPAMWAVALMIALALIALAAASARRLGAPVTEPLPASVHAAETVRGHGLLYRRARARGPSLNILRTAARRRLAEQLQLPPDSTLEAVAERVAAHTRTPAHRVRDVLAGDPPQSDDELVTAALAVQSLVNEVTGPSPVIHETDERDRL